MSLGCYECDRDMGPSQTLPGREGTMVHPAIVGLIYLPDRAGALKFRNGYLEAQHSRAFCFGCIESKIPEEKRIELTKVYAAYEAETNFERIQEEQKGRWIGRDDSRAYLDSHDQFEKTRNALASGCLFCGNGPANGKPFFRAKVIDRVYSGAHLSYWTTPNYSWSNFKRGVTSFTICFDDFRLNFPKTFEQLSYDMLGEENPNIVVPPSELYLSKEVIDAFAKEGKSVEDIEAEMDQVGVKVILDKRSLH